MRVVNIDEQTIEVWTADLPHAVYPGFHDLRAQRNFVHARLLAAGIGLFDPEPPAWP